MRSRWFGDPWPSAELRASICEDDHFRVSAPVGQSCIGCSEAIIAGERGVLMAAYMGMSEGFLSEDHLFVCAEHLDCHLRSILGSELAKLAMEQSGIERVP